MSNKTNNQVPNSSFKTTTTSVPLKRAPLAGRSTVVKNSPLVTANKAKTIIEESSDSSPVRQSRMPSSPKRIASPSRKSSIVKTVRSPSSSPVATTRRSTLKSPSSATQRKMVRSPSSSPVITNRKSNTTSVKEKTVRSPSSSPVAATRKSRVTSSTPERKTVPTKMSPSSNKRSNLTKRESSPVRLASGKTVAIPMLKQGTNPQEEKVRIEEPVTEAELLEEETKKLEDQAEVVGEESENEDEQLAVETVTSTEPSFREMLETKKMDKPLPPPIKKTVNPKLLEMASKVGPTLPPPTDPKPEYTPLNTGEVKYVVVRITCPKNLAIIHTWLEKVADSPSDNGSKCRDVMGGLYAVGFLRVSHRRLDTFRNRTGPINPKDDNYDEYKETIISIAAIHPAIWEVLQNSDFCKEGAYEAVGCYIEKHQIWPKEMASEHNDPPTVNNLYCNFKHRSFLPVEVSMGQMHDKMRNMVECGFLSREDYTIHNPTETRELDADPKLYCIIIFNKRVSDMDRASIKVCLDQSKFRGRIDPNSVSEDFPEGKHIPYMCIVTWVRLSTMNSIERKRLPFSNEKYPMISAGDVKKALSKDGRTRGGSNAADRGRRGGR